MTGPATLIAALAAGKNAARYIDQFLATGKTLPEDSDHLEKLIGQMGVFNAREIMPYKDFGIKLHPPVMEPEERVKSFIEAEGKVTASSARKEASRCLRCYRIAMAAV